MSRFPNVYLGHEYFTNDGSAAYGATRLSTDIPAELLHKEMVISVR